MSIFSDIFHLSNGNEKITQLILDSIPMAVLALKDRQILYANKGAELIFSWKRKEFLGKTTEFLYRNHQEFEEIGKNFYSKLVEKNMHRDIFPCRRKDGKDIICDIIAVRMGSNLSAEKEIVVIYDDITARIEAEKELERSGEAYRTFLESAHDIVLNITPQGKIINANKAGYEIFGYSKKELNDSKVENYIDSRDKEIFKKTFAKAVANQPVKEISTRFFTKSGKALYLEGNLVPKVFCGKITTVTAFFRDQTEKITAQNQIKEKIGELERFNKIVVDRELQMIKLKEKIEKLEKQSKN